MIIGKITHQDVYVEHVSRKRGIMAKYVVMQSRTKLYETNFMLPFLNLLAGIIWSIPVLQKVFPEIEGIASLGVGAVFSLLYVVLSVLPVIAIVPCVASGIMYTAILWGLADGISHGVIQIVVKVVILLVVIFVEFSIFGNATLRWLQHKFPEKPNIRVIKESKDE